MRLILTGILVLVMSGAVSAQESPATQPATEGVQAPVRPQRGGALGPRGRGMDLATRDATLQWASEHMPDLARYVLEFGRGRGAAPITAMIRARMLAYEEAPANSLVRERMRRNIATENQIGQYLNQMQTATAQERMELQQKIDAAMRENVEGLLRERQERIEVLRNRLEMEQRNLDQERQNMDQIVNRRLMPFRMALPGPDAPAAPAEPALAAPPGDGQ